MLSTAKFYVVDGRHDSVVPKILESEVLFKILADEGITETTGCSVMHENGWVEYQLESGHSICAYPVNEEEKLLTHPLATEILEIFDDFLVDKGIQVPSEDDDQRDPDNGASLYGTEYYQLLDSVEEYLVSYLEKHHISVIPDVFEE